MPRIHVCPLSRVDEVARRVGAASLVTLINPDFDVRRPSCIDASRHLRLSLADIDAPAEEHVAPGEDHVRDLVAFARAWGRREPMLIHCYAGVSRSTAAALIVAAALCPTRDERDAPIKRASEISPPQPIRIQFADGEIAATAGAPGVARRARRKPVDEDQSTLF